MILIVPEAGLAQLVASSALLAAAWPGACDEAKLLIHVLRMSVPSLADALIHGLISVLTPPEAASPSLISLAYRTAVLSAIARDEAGNLVSGPHLRPAEVWRLDVTDLSAGGRSGFRLAG